MTIDKALERLNNKLSLLAAAGGIAAAVAPEKILPFLYGHKIAVCIYLVVGVAPIQEFFHPMKTWEEIRKDRLGIVWLMKFAALWALVLVGSALLICQRETKRSSVALASKGNIPQEERMQREGVPINGKDKADITAPPLRCQIEEFRTGKTGRLK